jgi:hypothetical protein
MRQRRCSIHKEAKQSSYPTNEPSKGILSEGYPSNHIISPDISTSYARRLEERASMAASLGSRAAGLALEPSDESVNGEGLGERVTASGRGGRGGRGLLLGDGGSSWAGRRAGNGSGSVAAGAGSGGGSAGLGGGGGRAAGAEERRARDGVVDGGAVGAEENTGVSGLVQLSADNALWGLGSGTSDLDVQA